MTLGRETERQVDRRRRFADAALARGDGDDRGHAGQQIGARLRGLALAALATGAGLCGLRGRRARFAFFLGRQHGGHGQNAVHGMDRFFRLFADVFHLAGAGRIDLDGEGDVSVLLL